MFIVFRSDLKEAIGKAQISSGKYDIRIGYYGPRRASDSEPVFTAILPSDFMGGTDVVLITPDLQIVTKKPFRLVDDERFEAGLTIDTKNWEY